VISGTGRPQESRIFRSLKTHKKIAFYPNRKIFSPRFIAWNVGSDEKIKILTIWALYKLFINADPLVKPKSSNRKKNIFANKKRTFINWALVVYNSNAIFKNCFEFSILKYQEYIPSNAWFNVKLLHKLATSSSVQFSSKLQESESNTLLNYYRILSKEYMEMTGGIKEIFQLFGFNSMGLRLLPYSLQFKMPEIWILSTKTLTILLRSGLRIWYCIKKIFPLNM